MKGLHVQLPAVRIYSRCGARGSVFRDLAFCIPDQCIKSIVIHLL